MRSQKNCSLYELFFGGKSISRYLSNKLDYPFKIKFIISKHNIAYFPIPLTLLLSFFESLINSFKFFKRIDIEINPDAVNLGTIFEMAHPNMFEYYPGGHFYWYDKN